MKFLCDNCKAKYQIGDDKVAGKTVRMKCRRCGHSITVSSKVTESSVSRQMPADPNLANEPTFSVPPDAAPESGAGPRPVADPPRARPERPRPPMRSDHDDESTQIMQLPVRPEPGRPGAPPARPRPAAGAPPPPRASGVGGAAPAAFRAPAPPRPIGAAALRAPGLSPGPVRDLRQAPLQQVPQPSPSPPQAAVDPSGVAAAFQRAVSDPHATSSSRHPPHEDWYVGVGGQPLGPVRVDVIREKAMLGQVDGESLVWREGFDEWQPLKKFPELLEVVHGARMSRLAPRPTSPGERAPAPFQPRVGGMEDDARARNMGAAAALAAPAGGIRHASTASTYGTQAMPVAPAPAPAPVVARAPEPPAPAPMFAPAPVAAPAPAPVNAVSVLADPFAAPAAPGPSKPAPEPPVNLFAPPPPAEKPAAMFPPPASIASGPASAELSALIPKQRSGMHPMAMAFIAMAAVFGGVAAYVLLLKPPEQKIVTVDRIVQVPGSPATTGAATSEAQAPAADATASPTAKVAAGPGGGRVRSTGAATPTPTPPTPGGAPIDTSGFNNGGVAGPSGGTAPPAGAGGQLSQGEIQGVVTANQARIRRQCWEQALAAKSPNAPNSVKVTGTMTIGPSGNVENANASGGDSYPGLASCIAGKMKNWKFPPSGGSQTVAVPFVFAGQ